MHVTPTHTVEATKRKKCFQTLHEQANKMVYSFKVALNRLNPATQNNLFQPTHLMSYFRVAQNFASVQLNLRLKSCCDSL